MNLGLLYGQRIAAMQPLGSVSPGSVSPGSVLPGSVPLGSAPSGRVPSGPVTSPGAAETLQAAKAGLVDYLASSLTARDEPEVRDLLTWVRSQGECSGGPIPLGHDVPSAPSNTALVNGLQAHLLDLDDVHAGVRGHPSAVVLSALFAVADERTSGTEFLTAYVVGVEVMAALGRAFNPAHYLRGWHGTGTLGTLAAAAAVARLGRLNCDQIAMAMSLAASQAGGMRLQFGTMAKPLQAGLAARAGVAAVEWVQAGLSANADFLHPELGFFALHNIEPGKAQRLVEPQAGPWAIVHPGLWFKSHPFCSAAMSGADAVQQLVADHRFDRAQVVGVEVAFPAGGDTALVYSSPVTGEQGRFSIEYIVARILDGLPLNVEAFSNRPIEPDVQRTMGLVRRSMMASGEHEHVSADHRPTRVTIELARGQRLSATVSVPAGSAENPLSGEQQRGKLVDAVADEGLADGIISAVDELDGAALGPLLRLVQHVTSKSS